jgi:hydrogenase nickel incorporation protein HypA/HybF
MHELSVALALVEAASAKVRELTTSGAPVRLEAVHVRVGPLSGVVEDALRFSFHLAAEGTEAAGARLEIESEEVAVWCAECRARRPLADWKRRCPVCLAPAPRLVSGDALELVALEVTDVVAPAHR